MSLTKRTLEKKYSLSYHVIRFLKNSNYIEEALDGTLCSVYSSDDSLIYIKSNYYYKDNNLTSLFSLRTFRDKIKVVLDSCIQSSAFDYDLDRID